MLDRIAGQLEHYMSLLSARQKLTAANMANVDTPGYQTKDIDFQSEFQFAAKGSAPRTISVRQNEANRDGLERRARS